MSDPIRMLCEAAEQLGKGLRRMVEGVRHGYDAKIRAVSDGVHRTTAVGAGHRNLLEPIESRGPRKPLIPEEKLRAPTSEERWGAVRAAAATEPGRLIPAVFHSSELDELAGVRRLDIGLESLHPGSNSIKDRAALLVVPEIKASLLDGQKAFIVSSGNHALSYARECKRLDVPLVVVIPKSAEAIKRAKIESTGARIVEYGETYNEALGYGTRLAREEGGLIADVSDYDSVAALGTAVHDLLEMAPDTDTLLLHGAGGTVASAAHLAKETAAIREKDLTVLVACAEEAPTIARSWLRNEPVFVKATTSAGGARVDQVDPHLLPVIREYVDGVVLVPEERVRAGPELLTAHLGTPVEGAGGMGVMALVGSGGLITDITGREFDLRRSNVATLITGGNK